MSVALVVCLNIGVDPPDVLKIAPCARAECWIHPLLGPPAKALDAIGKALQAHYERWQPRARYKTALDPTVDDVRKLCVSCRRNAKQERILFHYNGHGVPRPTANGEVWVFNKSYTQYLPLSVFDLLTWTGAPAIYVLDCSGAGHVINAFLAAGPDAFAPPPSMADNAGKPSSSSGGGLGALLGPPDSGDARAAGSSGRGGAAAAALLGITPASAPLPTVADGSATAPTGSGGDGDADTGAVNRECIFLAACAAHELLPCGPDLPADLFTSCLTTPIKTALRWFCLRSPLRVEAGLDPELADLIPGQQNNRKTPLGELNWIFTAITDTIAWNVLPRPLFHRLFRQDLLLASLFRNFLLAERIMRALGCTPCSHPALPSTAGHPLWAAWDMALEACLLQLPALLAAEQAAAVAGQQAASGGTGGSTAVGVTPASLLPAFVPSNFFAHQLGAFEVWLQHGDASTPPEQLPVVLQVLLSQSHRLRALLLLGRFLDKGPWAVDLALAVGVFPYVLKLLQTTAADLRHVLVFIWAKILAVDRSCQADLIKDNAFLYFLRFLDTPLPQQQQQQQQTQGEAPLPPPQPGVPGHEERALAAFVLAAICVDHPRGQAACGAANMAAVCLAAMPAAGESLVKWLMLALANLWRGSQATQADAFSADAPSVLAPLLAHTQPEVRCAAVAALGALISVPVGPGGAAPSSRPGASSASDAAGAAGASRSDSPDGPGSSHASQQLQDGVAGGGPLPEASRNASERAVASQLLPLTSDASPLVRYELAVALARVAAAHPALFHGAVTAWLRSGRTAGIVSVGSAAYSPSADVFGQGGAGMLPPSFGASIHPMAGSGSSSAVSSLTAGMPRPRTSFGAVRPHMSSHPSRLSVGTSFFANQESQLGFMSMGDFAALGPTPAGNDADNMPILPPGASVVPSSGGSGSSGASGAPSLVPSPLRRSGSSLGSTDRLPHAPVAVPPASMARFAGVSVYSDSATGGYLYSPAPLPGWPMTANSSIASGLGDSATGGGGSSSGGSGGLYASADAARIGGGLYMHVLEALVALATDPAPRVRRTGRQALTALGIERVLGPTASTSGREQGGSRHDQAGEGSRHAGGGTGSVHGGTACTQAGGSTHGGGTTFKWTRRLSSWMLGTTASDAGGSTHSGGGSLAGGSRHGASSPDRSVGPSAALLANGAYVDDGEMRTSDGTAAWMALQAGLASGGASLRGGSTAAALLAAACTEAASAPLPCLPASVAFERSAAQIGRPLLVAPPASSAAAGAQSTEQTAPMPTVPAGWFDAPFHVSSSAMSMAIDEVDSEDADIEAAAAAVEEMERTQRAAAAAAAAADGDVLMMNGQQAYAIPRRPGAPLDASGRRAARRATIAARCARLASAPPPRCTELLAVSPHRTPTPASTASSAAAAASGSIHGGDLAAGDGTPRDLWRGSLDAGTGGAQRNSVDLRNEWPAHLPPTAITSLVHHPLRRVTAFGDASGTVRVWVRPDSDNSGQASSGIVGRLPMRIASSPVVSLHLVNATECDDPLLLAGYDDGTVAVWRHWQPRLLAGHRTDGPAGGPPPHAWLPPPQLATAWRALPSTLYGRHAGPRVGASFSFQQAAGCLYVAGGGDAGGSSGGGQAAPGALHVWDLAAETLADAVPFSTLAAGAGVTCLSAASGALLLGGCSDGRLLSFDLRCPARLLSSARVHTAPLRDVLLHPGGPPHALVTASVAGELVWSDLRALMEPLAVVQAFPNGGLTCCVAHAAAPVLAAGSAGERCVKLFDVSAQPLGSIKYHVAFLGQRIAPVTSLAFAPTEAVLAAGGMDGLASLYAPPEALQGANGG